MRFYLHHAANASLFAQQAACGRATARLRSRSHGSPASSTDSCTADSRTTPSPGAGHRKRPRSSRFVTRINPEPS